MVGNVEAEPPSARDSDLDEVEPVGSQVFGQPGVVRQPHFLGSEVKDEDIPDFCRYVGHHTLHHMLPGQAPPASATPSLGSPPATKIARHCYALREHDTVAKVTQGASCLRAWPGTASRGCVPSGPDERMPEQGLDDQR